MKKVILLFLISPIVIFSVQGQTDIEKEIISYIIEEEFSPVPDESFTEGNEQNKNIKDQEEISIVIISESRIQTFNSRFDSLEGFQNRGLASLDLYMMNDFFKKNKSSVKITEFSLDKIKIIYLSKEEWDGIMKQGYWKQYHNLYGYIPVINLSRPGINKNLDKAFIYYDAKSDKLGGSGFLITLAKVDNKWIIKEKIIAWKS
jgi:hypothetical protein